MENLLTQFVGEILVGLSGLLIGFVSKFFLDKRELAKLKASAQESTERANKATLENEQIKNELQNNLEMALLQSRNRLAELIEELSKFDDEVRNLKNLLGVSRLELDKVKAERIQLQRQLEECRQAKS